MAEKKPLLETNPIEEVVDVPGSLTIEGLQQMYQDRYEKSSLVQQKLREHGLRKPKQPNVPGLISDENGEITPPADVTNLTSSQLGEYHNYYTSMLAWVGRLLWIADIDKQAAESVRKEVEGYFDLQDDIRQYGHRDERIAKRNRRKTVYYSQRLAEEKSFTHSALEREYELYSRLAFMISREITRREKRTDDL